jgi:hypothetical protein
VSAGRRRRGAWTRSGAKCATLLVARHRGRRTTVAARSPGRLAQRESASFTPRRSLVRSQYRPPDHPRSNLGPRTMLWGPLFSTAVVRWPFHRLRGHGRSTHGSRGTGWCSAASTGPGFSGADQWAAGWSRRAADRACSRFAPVAGRRDHASQSRETGHDAHYADACEQADRDAGLIDAAAPSSPGGHPAAARRSALRDRHHRPAPGDALAPGPAAAAGDGAAEGRVREAPRGAPRRPRRPPTPPSATSSSSGNWPYPGSPPSTTRSPASAARPLPPWPAASAASPPPHRPGDTMTTAGGTAFPVPQVSASSGS